MKITNPFIILFNFIRLVIARYGGINLMRERIEDIFNYLKISDLSFGEGHCNLIGTGGQPTEKQLSLIRNAGYDIVINLALSTSENALPDEKKSVESLGMKYISIPINFNDPKIEEFELFCQKMQENKDRQIFIHCAANLRVSVFMYLYRQLYLNVSQEQAKTDLEKLWIPNKTWQNLIDSVLKNKQCYS